MSEILSQDTNHTARGHLYAVVSRFTPVSPTKADPEKVGKEKAQIHDIIYLKRFFDKYDTLSDVGRHVIHQRSRYAFDDNAKFLALSITDIPAHSGNLPLKAYPKVPLERYDIELRTRRDIIISAARNKSPVQFNPVTRTLMTFDVPENIQKMLKKIRGFIWTSSAVGAAFLAEEAWGSSARMLSDAAIPETHSFPRHGVISILISRETPMILTLRAIENKLSFERLYVKKGDYDYEVYTKPPAFLR